MVEMLKIVNVKAGLSINFDDFTAMMTNKLNEPKTTEELIEAFKTFDSEGNGLVHIEEIMTAFENLGEGIVKLDEVKKIMEKGINAEGYIKYDDFVKNVLKGKVL